MRYARTAKTCCPRAGGANPPPAARRPSQAAAAPSAAPPRPTMSAERMRPNSESRARLSGRWAQARRAEQAGTLVVARVDDEPDDFLADLVGSEGGPA